MEVKRICQWCGKRLSCISPFYLYRAGNMFRCRISWPAGTDPHIQVSNSAVYMFSNRLFPTTYP